MKCCRNIKRVLGALVLSFAGLAHGEGFDESSCAGFRYGPNLSVGFMGNTPFVWGEWLPQAVGKVRYTWLEPLDSLNYREKLEKNPTYLRMEGGLEITPFYGGYSAGLGLRPIKMNPQFEISFMYESYLYFRSNLEMVTADVAGSGRIADSWNADYITDNVWSDDAKFDYVQLFDFALDISFAFPGGSVLGAAVHYILSDVSTDFDGKSYDYKRNIPVFSRDFLIEVDAYGRSPLHKNVALLFKTNYYRTGNLRSGGSVEKESLSYIKALIGPHFSWDDGLQNFSLELGGWRRIDDRFYNGSVAQEFLVQLEYEWYFSFPGFGDLPE